MVEGLPSPQSELKFIRHDPDTDRVFFNAVHFTDTIDQEIRVFLNEQSEISAHVPAAEKLRGTLKKGARIVPHGYQEVYRFPLVLDFKAREVYVFTIKDTAHAFMRRFRKTGRIEYAPLHFDLKKIEEAEQVKNVVGAWASNLGRVKTMAFYGTEVHRDLQVKQREVKCFNVHYTLGDDDEEPVDLYIGAECSLSSRSQRVKDRDLVEIYECLKDALGVEEVTGPSPGRSRQGSQSRTGEQSPPE